MHPRTRGALEAQGIVVGSNEPLLLIDPVGYLEFMSLVEGSAGVITDSGGVQEETTYLGIPCFTLRANTERPITSTQGTNTMLGLEPKRIADVPGMLAETRARPSGIPDYWDGAAARRIVDVLAQFAVSRRACHPDLRAIR